MTIKEQVYAACEHEMNNRLNFFERVLMYLLNLLFFFLIQQIMLAPLDKNFLQSTFPIPPLQPVINTVLFSKSIIISYILFFFFLLILKDN